MKWCMEQQSSQFASECEFSLRYLDLCRVETDVNDDDGTQLIENNILFFPHKMDNEPEVCA